MATTTTAHRLAVNEYLLSVFRPDRDYIDGEVQ